MTSDFDRYRAHISGAPTLTPDTSPVTDEVLIDVPAMSPTEALDVVTEAAEAAQTWRAVSYQERREVLLRAADILQSELDDHVETLMLETGATRAWGTMNVLESAATLREAAGMTSLPVGTLLPSADPSTINHSLREPAGVSLSIVPWNAPVILAARSSAVSLAVGNSVVIRPSEEAPVSAGFVLADAVTRAGAPRGLVSLVTNAPGAGPDVINALIADPRIRRVAFIGSTRVGRKISAAAGEALTPAVLELGGKNATIVRSDADLDAWAPKLAFASFAHSGQVCMCTDRILVHRSRYEETVERLAAIADSMTVGDPRDPDTDLGPLINDDAVHRYLGLIADATENSASVVAGGRADGRHARPTVLAEVNTSCAFHQEEGFVPMVSVSAFDSDDDAIELANAGDLGLIGSIASADRDTAYAMARRMRAGAVHINGPSIGDEPHVPFGGVAMSGSGRLGGEESYRFFTEQRSLYVH